MTFYASARGKKELPLPWTGDAYACGFPCTLLTELALRAASNAIREKPIWWEKFKDPIISGRWKQELQTTGDDPLTEDQVRFVFQELEWYADLRQQQIDQGVEAPIERAIDGTRRSDGLVPDELKQRLLVCVGKLINIPDHLKDWHPGSNNQVLDLVHPSLFPAIVGRTHTTKEAAIPALEFVGKGEVLKADKSDGSKRSQQFYSESYQWLPTDFEVSATGKMKILSYINNLHPVEHAEMYPVLAEIFERFVPMFEQVLADMLNIWDKEPRLTVDPANWYEIPDEFKSSFLRNIQSHYREMEWRRVRVPKPVEIPAKFVVEDVNLPKPYNLKATKGPLQVIVKLANIELTPENPIYGGGSWHVEGMENENIVASGIYYYHSENVTETRLNFRIHVREPEYQQGDHRGCELMYGLMDDAALNQSLDGIMTKQDRCIVFPNIYQHQVQPFELEDKTRPGSRQILVYFLVNPQKKILSTTHVPPQQWDWAQTAGMLGEVSSRLPPELVNQVEGYLEWPMSLTEAREHREMLMEERKYFVERTNEEIFERLFSLCEH
ncbi:hypothetical protein BGZ83_001586 [Gryganskiella cystojenkinii]|nr:hypothetical protein BGZ83_001586 [Gryganskiella cystojenkinii]